MLASKQTPHGLPKEKRTLETRRTNLTDHQAQPTIMIRVSRYALGNDGKADEMDLTTGFDEGEGLSTEYIDKVENKRKSE